MSSFFLFFSGTINFEDKKSGIKLKDAWNTFLIDSVQLADLKWVSKPKETVSIFHNEI